MDLRKGHPKIERMTLKKTIDSRFRGNDIES
jgi:hypothetical protein